MYSQESDTDSQLCQELESWLYTLFRQNSHTTKWHMVLPGNDFQMERRSHFLKADIILLLISVDFIRSERCYNEMHESIKQCARGAVVVPILLRPIGDLSILPISSLQPLPRNRRPVSRWKDRDSCWQHITQEIREILVNVPEIQSEATLIGLDGETDRQFEVQHENDDIGTNIGSYKIDRLIASGGTSIVYQAKHEIIKKTAAVKIIKYVPENWRSKDLFDAAFLSEAKAASLVAHPGVIDIFDFGKMPDKRSYIIMEFLSGETLGERLKRTKLGLYDSLQIIWQLATIMMVAHGHGVIHGDLKPDNIMIIPDEFTDNHERLKVIDFGIGRIIGEPSLLWDNRDEFFGTPSYAAPEIFGTMDPITAKSDVYTLGSDFYQILTGRPPYVREEADNILRQKIKEEPLDIRRLDPSIPKPVAELVHLMLDRRPESRPTMEDVKHEVANLQKNHQRG